MNSPMLPFLAEDIVWAEVPIILWLLLGTITMLIVVGRFGRERGYDVLTKYRLFWGVTLVLSIAAAVVLHFWSGQPAPRYL